MTENIKYFICGLWRLKTIQKWINHHYNDNENLIIDSKYFPYVVTKNGEIFSNSSQIYTVKQAMTDYILDDIQKDDIVIDIGANVGGFCIPAAKLSNYVYAIEPITTDELRHNISKNNLNVRVIEGGLGNGMPSEVIWNKKKTVKTYTFAQIKSICGGCDFLKCDCEGFEWFIRPSELEGIRRLEMEIHNFNPSPNDPTILINGILNEFNISLNSMFFKKSDDFFKFKFKKNINRIGEIDEVAILHGNRK
ncbi:hypothetical protein J2741_000893 [Methanolinea mesophila]|uniref:FkbM family methyltransferase n=1 Tax=Methanolinea mesophila TaxID=547055 RepID=UPI001AE5F248|nr:FkbM family methyltransferase [Methanolinea mesophila]MBP1928346.1 hypothetical protein [Methanolinea mesophila]